MTPIPMILTTASAPGTTTSGTPAARPSRSPPPPLCRPAPGRRSARPWHLDRVRPEQRQDEAPHDRACERPHREPEPAPEPGTGPRASEQNSNPSTVTAPAPSRSAPGAPGARRPGFARCGPQARRPPGSHLVRHSGDRREAAGRAGQDRGDRVHAVAVDQEAREKDVGHQEQSHAGEQRRPDPEQRPQGVGAAPAWRPCSRAARGL